MLIGRRALLRKRSKQADSAAGRAAEQKVVEKAAEQLPEAPTHDEGRKGQRPQRRS